MHKLQSIITCMGVVLATGNDTDEARAKAEEAAHKTIINY